MGFGPVAFVAGEGAGLVPDRVGYRDTAKVVDEGGRLGDWSARFQGQCGDGAGVAARPRRLEIGKVRQDEQRVVDGLLGKWWTGWRDCERGIPGVGLFHLFPPALGEIEGEIGEIRIIRLGTPPPDRLKSGDDAVETGEDFEFLAELGDPHGSRDREAFDPLRQTAAVPPLKVRGERCAHGFVETEPDGEGVSDFAGGPEVHLGCLPAAGQHSENRAEPAKTGQPRACQRDHQPNELGGIGAVGLQGPSS